MISGADRIDLPLASYGIADLQRFRKIAVCVLLCGCIAQLQIIQICLQSLRFQLDRQNLNPRKRLRILGPITYNRFTSISLVLLMNADLSINIFVLSRFKLSLLASLDSLNVEKVAWVCFCLFIKKSIGSRRPIHTQRSRMLIGLFPDLACS